jgi:hypothetical protein
MKTTVISLLCAIIVASCTNSLKHNETASEAQIKEAHTAAQNFLDNLAKNDTAAIMASFSRSPEFTMVEAGGIYKWAEMRPIAQQMLGSISKQTFENITDNYLFLNSSVFIYDYKCINKMYEQSGVVTTIDPLVASYTFQKEPDGWKIIHLHETWLNTTTDSSMVKK